MLEEDFQSMLAASFDEPLSEDQIVDLRMVFMGGALSLYTRVLEGHGDAMVQEINAFDEKLDAEERMS